MIKLKTIARLRPSKLEHEFKAKVLKQERRQDGGKKG